MCVDAAARSAAPRPARPEHVGAARPARHPIRRVDAAVRRDTCEPSWIHVVRGETVEVARIGHPGVVERPARGPQRHGLRREANARVGDALVDVVVRRRELGARVGRSPQRERSARVEADRRPHRAPLGVEDPPRLRVAADDRRADEERARGDAVVQPLPRERRRTGVSGPSQAEHLDVEPVAQRADARGRLGRDCARRRWQFGARAIRWQDRFGERGDTLEAITAVARVGAVVLDDPAWTIVEDASSRARSGHGGRGIVAARGADREPRRDRSRAATRRNPSHPSLAARHSGDRAPTRRIDPSRGESATRTLFRRGSRVAPPSRQRTTGQSAIAFGGRRRRLATAGFMVPSTRVGVTSRADEWSRDPVVDALGSRGAARFRERDTPEVGAMGNERSRSTARPVVGIARWAAAARSRPRP